MDYNSRDIYPPRQPAYQVSHFPRQPYSQSGRQNFQNLGGGYPYTALGRDIHIPPERRAAPAQYNQNPYSQSQRQTNGDVYNSPGGIVTTLPRRAPAQYSQISPQGVYPPGERASFYRSPSSLSIDQQYGPALGLGQGIKPTALQPIQRAIYPKAYSLPPADKDNMSVAMTHEPMSLDPHPLNDHLSESILVTLFCCFPIGIAAMIKAKGARDAYKEGDVAQAYSLARTAGRLTVAALAAGLCLIIIILVIVFTVIM